MKGMGTIVKWSIVDETQHTEGMIELFKAFVKENINIPFKWYQSDPNIRLNVLEQNVINIAKDMVELEERFIDLIFKKFKSGEFLGLTTTKLKKYIRFIADIRLTSMGFAKVFNVPVNPLPDLEVMIGAASHTNFFESPSTDYAAVSVTGKWDDVWDTQV
jgi:ribonucleoside-diphosphate reductase beta chain